jgi:hypothetical protein
MARALRNDAGDDREQIVLTLLKTAAFVIYTRRTSVP